MKVAGIEVPKETAAAWLVVKMAEGREDVLVAAEYVAADGSPAGRRCFYVVEVKAKADTPRNRKAGTVGDEYAVTVTADERGEIIPRTDDDGNVITDEDGNPAPKVRSRNPLSFIPDTVTLIPVTND